MDESSTKSYGPPATSFGRRMSRGSERGTCTTANPLARPNASGGRLAEAV
jgi:hypothetical protein